MEQVHRRSQTNDPGNMPIITLRQWQIKSMIASKGYLELHYTLDAIKALTKQQHANKNENR